VATRKDEKERRRRERLEAERREAAEARRRLVFGYVAAGLLAAVVLVGIVVAVAGGGDDGQQVESGDVPEEAHVDLQSGTPPEGVPFDDREGAPPPPLEQADLEVAAREAGCDVELGLPDEGANHLQPDQEPPEYGTNPPTSGDHSPEPAADGAYRDPVEPVNFLHSFEHGRVAILYDPQLPEADQLAVKGVFDEDPAGTLLFPYPDMPHDVAVGAWTNLVTCESYSERVLDVIRDFRDLTRGNGPEAVPL
jgi:hypothetical protein